MTHFDYVGVDGCSGGWLAVGLNRSGGHGSEVFENFGALLGRYGSADLVLVDIPIGLPDGPGGRDCDREARRRLRPRGSTVFPTPTRSTAHWAAKRRCNYKGAAEVERCQTGKAISRQTFAICPKIAEVDEVLCGRGGDARPTVREVHPEICFWALNGGSPVTSSKKRPRGQKERLRILSTDDPRSALIFEDACKSFLRKCVAKDDILDALAAAVVASRSEGALRTVPEHPPLDAEGLPMEIVYWPQPGMKAME